MAKNRYWAIRYSHGWFDPRLSYTRRDAIAKYLKDWENSPKYSFWTWRRHKDAHGVEVVKVDVVAVEEAK